MPLLNGTAAYNQLKKISKSNDDDDSSITFATILFIRTQKNDGRRSSTETCRFAEENKLPLALTQ